MRVTQLGHACLLVEAAGTRLLIDPGVYSDDFTTLTDLDAVLVTHQHADHIDSERLPALLTANPRAELFAEPETVAVLEGWNGPTSTPRPFGSGQSATVGALVIEGVGDRHAFNHADVPRCGNTGF